MKIDPGAHDVLAVDFDLNVPARMVAELDFLVAPELSIQIHHAAVFDMRARG
jgi:hypothetical protein